MSAVNTDTSKYGNSSLKDVMKGNVLTEAMEPSKTAQKLILTCCDNIPAAMRDVNRWVCWTEGKRPITANGSAARVNDFHTWCDFETAVNALDNNPIASGIGFVLGDGFTGIDIDGGINEHGGLSPLAADIVRMFNSYTEVSPSGKGLHIIAKADWPELMEQANIRLKIGGHEEIALVGHSGYFTVTGNVYDDHKECIDGQSALDKLMKLIMDLSTVKSNVSDRATAYRSIQHTQPRQAAPATTREFDAARHSDSELLDIARNWNNGRGAKFAALYDSGDTSGYPSHSEADQALCNYLAHLTQCDFDRIDGLFRDSALYRPEKWDRRGRGYARSTILKAMRLIKTGGVRS